MKKNIIKNVTKILNPLQSFTKSVNIYRKFYQNVLNILHENSKFS